MKSVPGARLRQMAVVLTMFLGLPATIWAAPARQFGDTSDTSTTTTTATPTPTPIVIPAPLLAPASSPVPSFDTAQQAGSVTIGVITFAPTKGATPDVRFAFGPKSLNAGFDYVGASTSVPIRWVLRFQESDINWGDALPTATSGHADVTLERQDHDYLFIGEFQLVLFDGAREITKTTFEVYDPDASSSSASVAAPSIAADNSSDDSDNSSSADNSSDDSDNSSDDSDNSSDDGDNASVDNSSDDGDNASADNSSDDGDNASDDDSDNSSDDSDNSSDDGDNASVDNSSDDGDNAS